MVRHFRLKTCFPVFSSCVTLFLRDIFKNFLEPRFQSTSQFPPKNTYHMHTGHFSCVTIVCVTYPKNFFRASLSCRLVNSRLEIPTTCTQDLFSSWLLFAWHTQNKKFLRASLSCRLVSSRLKIPTTCTRDFFFLHMWLLFAWHPKLSYSLTLMVVSRFPPKNTYHMHRGLFFMWLLFAWHTPNKFLRASLSCWLVSSCLKILTTCKQEFFHNVTIVYVTSINILQPHFHGG